MCEHVHACVLRLCESLIVWFLFVIIMVVEGLRFSDVNDHICLSHDDVPM